MDLKSVVIICIATVALADYAPRSPPPLPLQNEAPSYPPPPPPPPPQPQYLTPYPPPPPPPPPTQPEAPVQYAHVAPKYHYKYDVNDHNSGATYEVSEQRDGDNTEGEYIIEFPDGRKQIFKYADNGNGLVVNVKYEENAVQPAPTPYTPHLPPTTYPPPPPSTYAPPPSSTYAPPPPPPVSVYV